MQPVLTIAISAQHADELRHRACVARLAHETRGRRWGRRRRTGARQVSGAAAEVR